MKIFMVLLSLSLLVNFSFAGSDCIECDSMVLAGSSPGSGTGTLGQFGKIAKNLKQERDYESFCRKMGNGEPREAFLNLRDFHHQTLEDDYFEIRCGKETVMEFATDGGANGSTLMMVKYLKMMEKRNNKKYLLPILNYIDPSRPKDTSLLDVSQLAINDLSPGNIRNSAESLYKILKREGAKHSFYFCVKENIPTKECLNP